MKPGLNEEDEVMFFHWLGFRFYSTVLKGHMLGHKRPMSAARDYLHFKSLEGMDREASEFLVDVANMGRRGGLSMQELYDKWELAATWHPSGRRSAELQKICERENES